MSTPSRPRLSKPWATSLANFIVSCALLVAVLTFDVPIAVLLGGLAGCVGWGIASYARFVKRERRRVQPAVGERV